MRFITSVFSVATCSTVASSSTNLNPCEELCRIDGPRVCRNGSYPRSGGICHGYFVLPSGDRCYHTTETRSICPDSLPALSLDQARIMVSENGGSRSRRHVVAVSPAPPVVTTSPIPESSPSPVEPEAPAPRRVRRVFAVTQPVEIRTEQVSTTSAPTTPQRPRRCFPAGAPVSPATPRPIDNVPSTLPPPRSIAPPTAPMAARLPLNIVPGRTLADDIRAIAIAEIGTSESAWTTLGGDRLLAWARSAPCARAYLDQNACFAVILLASRLPREFIETKPELIEFLRRNTENLRAMLLASEANSVAAGRSGLTHPQVACFAQNWISVFPEIFDGVSRTMLTRLKSIVVRHRINMYAIANGERGTVQAIVPHVNREHAFAESAQYLTANAARIRRGVSAASFEGESGRGQGVRRDWFTSVADQLYAGDFGLFERSEGAPHYTRISQFSDLDENFRYYFLAIGRFMALSIIEGVPIGVYFPNMFYKRLIGQQIVLADLEEDEPAYYRSFSMVLNMSDEEMEAMDVAIEHSGFEVSVNATNRDAQIESAIRSVSINGKVEQFAALREGFSSAIPDVVFEGIEPHEVGAFIFGDSVISVDDLERNYRLEGYGRGASQVTNLFTVLRELSQDDLRKFLRFVTSNSQLPLGGFGSLEPRFQIQRMARLGASGSVLLPATHTCFNTIDLPMYESIDELREHVVRAINLDASMGII